MANLLSKALILARDRQDVGARVQNKLDFWADRFSSPSNLVDVADFADIEAAAGALFSIPSPPDTALRLLDIEKHIEILRRQKTDGPFPPDSFHNGTATLGTLCYLACRYLRPRVVVETGVAYGVTSTYILAALKDNAYGELHSVDLPPLAVGAAAHVGHFVPLELRSRWKLNLGPAKKLLPDILDRTKPIDLFVHDSLHTYFHMKCEFESALSALRPGGVLISDDIDGNRAFQEMIQGRSIDSWLAIRQSGKNALCGAARTKLRN
jgi:predicted O-methyltransferase YrrM